MQEYAEQVVESVVERMDMEFGPITERDAAHLLDRDRNVILAFAEPEDRRTDPNFPEANFRGDIWGTVNTMDLAHDEKYWLVFNPGRPEEEEREVNPPWRGVPV